MSSSRYSRRNSLRTPPSTRVTRHSHPTHEDLTGVPMMCPINFCNTPVPPSFAHDGTVEYRCYVGNHGRIGKVVNGRIELTVRTVVSPRRRVYPNRPRCVYPGCTLPRNSTCGRRCCLRDCLLKPGSCGGYKHNYARGLKDLEARQRQESLEVHPGTPLFFPSPTPSPAPSPSPPPPSSPVPGVDYDPSAAYVQLVFVDREVTFEAVCAMQGDLVNLERQDPRVRDGLHVHHIRPGTLEYLGPDGDWYLADITSVPARYGQLYMRAHTADNARRFPRTHFVDMAPSVDRFYRLVSRNVSPDRAFEFVFDCEATATDHESLVLCRDILNSSPRHLRERFNAAGRTPQGTWAEFVHCCADSQGPRASTPPSDGASSPTFGRSRPAWRGPPSSEAGSSSSYNQNASPPPMIIDSDSE